MSQQQQGMEQIPAIVIGEAIGFLNSVLNAVVSENYAAVTVTVKDDMSALNDRDRLMARINTRLENDPGAPEFCIPVGDIDMIYLPMISAHYDAEWDSAVFTDDDGYPSVMLFERKELK